MPHVTTGRRFDALRGLKSRVSRHATAPHGKISTRPSACPCPAVPGVDSSDTSDADGPPPVTRHTVESLSRQAPSKPPAVRARSRAPPLPATSPAVPKGAAGGCAPPQELAPPMHDEAAIAVSPTSLVEQIAHMVELSNAVPRQTLQLLMTALPAASDFYRSVHTHIASQACRFEVNESSLAPGMYDRTHQFVHENAVWLTFGNAHVLVKMVIGDQVSSACLDAHTASLTCGGVRVEAAIRKHNIEAKVSETTLTFHSSRLATVDDKPILLLPHEKIMLVARNVLIEACHE